MPFIYYEDTGEIYAVHTIEETVGTFCKIINRKIEIKKENNGDLIVYFGPSPDNNDEPKTFTIENKENILDELAFLIQDFFNSEITWIRSNFEMAHFFADCIEDYTNKLSDLRVKNAELSKRLAVSNEELTNLYGITSNPLQRIS